MCACIAPTLLFGLTHFSSVLQMVQGSTEEMMDARNEEANLKIAEIAMKAKAKEKDHRVSRVPAPLTLVSCNS